MSTATNNLESFCHSTGLRRHELEQVTADDIHRDEKGRVIVLVRHGKGGKRRYVVALDDTPLIFAEKARERGDTRLFTHIPSNAPTHYWRGEYARELYHRHARPLEQIPREEQYRCRAEKQGTILDRQAMFLVSKNLGHNRLGVVTLYLF